MIEQKTVAVEDLPPKVMRENWEEGDAVSAWPYQTTYDHMGRIVRRGFGFYGVYDGMGSVIVEGRAYVKIAR